MSHREYAKATVKVTLTGPDGKVLKVIEGENPDPFNWFVVYMITLNVSGPSTETWVVDAFGNAYYFDSYTPSPVTSMGYLVSGFCVTNCPNTGSTPPNAPGIWLFNSPPPSNIPANVSPPITIYDSASMSSPSFIAGLSYSPPKISTGGNPATSPGEVLYESYIISQSITNTLSSPVDVYTIFLVGAVYGSLSQSPVYMPVTFYVFSPPIVFSPGVTMTVTVALNFPVGVTGPYV